MGPLAGLRVVDMTRILAGPWCTQILGDLGAEVIKIEHPTVGDDTRQWGPPWLQDEAGNETGESSYYLSANRSKSSVTLDLKTERGRTILRELVAGADVFIENFKVGGLAKLELDYDSLKAVKADLVYLSITGFGQTGPMADQPGYDYLIQGLGGLMSITGVPDGMPGAGPQRVGVAISDVTTGLYAVIGLLAALRHRDQTGEGQYIDLALMDTQVSWLANQALNYFVGGKVPQRTGSWHPNLAPYQPFKATDGDVIIAVGNDSQFRKLCDFLALPALADDPRFRTNPDRNRHRDELEPLIQDRIAAQPMSYWLENLPAIGVPCSAINTIDQTFAEPQVQARGMQIELPHPLAGTVPGVANPLRFSRSDIEYRKPPPTLGEDTDRVLRDVLGYGDDDIEALRRDGVLGPADRD